MWQKEQAQRKDLVTAGSPALAPVEVPAPAEVPVLAEALVPAEFPALAPVLDSQKE